MIKIIQQLKLVIPHKYSKKIAFILSIVFIQALVETMAIAAILPFLAVVSAPKMVESNFILTHLFAWSPAHTINGFMLFLGGIFFLIIALGNLFACFASWYFLRFGMLCGHQLSSDLFKKYLMQPYAFFLNHNSSFLISNIIAEISRVILGILVNLLQMFSKSIMALFMLGLLVAIDWKLALAVVGVLGSTYTVAYSVIKKKLQRAGVTSSYCNTHRYKSVKEAFSVIKELKLLGTESFFYQTYKKYSLMYAENETKSQVLPQVSRYLIEIIAFGGILLIVMYLLLTQSELSKALPLLGLYALTGYRLMPALQQIFAGLSTIRYHSHALDAIVQEFQRPNRENLSREAPLAFDISIAFHDVSFHYENTSKPALHKITLTIHKNASIGIVGGSGAGKTTLVDLLLGLFLTEKGHIAVDGLTLTKENIHQWRSNVGYVPQMIRLVDDTIRNNIALGIAENDIDELKLKHAASMAGIAPFIDNLPNGYSTVVGEEGARLSGGQKQRLGIARALYHNPQVLVLDEATSALDSFSEKIIVDTLKALSDEKTVIIIAHRLSTVKHCQEIVLMDKGKIIDKGSYDDLFVRNQHFNEMVSGLNR